MTWEFSERIAIAGVGYSSIERRTARALDDLTAAAVDAALADAGVGREVIDGIATSPSMPRYGGAKGVIEGIDVVTPHALARTLGVSQQTVWIGATEAMVTQSVMDAAMALASGVCTHVIVYRAVHVPVGKYIDFAHTHAGGREQFLAPYGFTSPPAWIATVVRRYLHLYGYQVDDLLPHLVANRENAHRNPDAYWANKPLTLQDCRDARMISDPVSILDCDLPVDGAVALLLTTTERARDMRQKPALLRGFASSMFEPAGGAPMNWEDMRDGAAHTAERLWRHSGVTAADIDVAQLYDGFSFLIYPWLEGMGFTEAGDGVAFTRDGKSRLDGPLPINTGGGSLAEGRLHGMTQLAEAVRQVNGTAGERAVDRVTHSLATISNGLAKSTAFVFSADR